MSKFSLKTQDNHTLSSDTQTMEQRIDALIMGTPLEMVVGEADLHPEEWEMLVIADRLANAQLAERTQVRGALQEWLGTHLMEYQETKPKRFKFKFGKLLPWLLILAGGMILITLIVGAGALFFFPTRQVGYPPEPIVYYDNHNSTPTPYYPGDPEYVYPVYDLGDDAVFGNTFRLRQMISRNDNPYDPNDMSIILIWDVLDTVEDGRYTIYFRVENYDTDWYPEDQLRILLPSQQTLSFAVEFNTQNYRAAPAAGYRIQIIDNLTGNGVPLLLPNGDDYLLLKSVPASIQPSIQQPADTQSTATPIPTPKP